MQDLVSNRRASIFAVATALSVLWALFAVPGGQPWAGRVWLAALAALTFLFVSTIALLLRAGPPPSLVMVAPGAVGQAADLPTGGGLDGGRMRRRD